MLMRSFIKKFQSLVLLLTFATTAVNAADESYIQSLSGKIKRSQSQLHREIIYIDIDRYIALNRFISIIKYRYISINWIKIDIYL